MQIKISQKVIVVIYYKTRFYAFEIQFISKFSEDTEVF